MKPPNDKVSLLLDKLVKQFQNRCYQYYALRSNYLRMRQRDNTPACKSRDKERSLCVTRMTIK